MFELEIHFEDSGEYEVPVLRGNTHIIVKDCIGTNPKKAPPSCTIGTGAFPLPMKVRCIGIAVLEAVYRVE